MRENEWLKRNSKKLNYYSYQMEKLKLMSMPSNDSLNYTELSLLFTGAILEIKKLQNKVNQLEKQE